MRIDVVTTTAALEGLQDEWDRLVDEAAGDGAFVSHPWVAAWWRAYGAGARLHVVCVRDAAGALCGIAPLYVDGGAAGTPALLRFLGTGGDTSPDYVGVIARHGRERDVAAAVVDHLHGGEAPPWDAALLSDLAEESAMTDALEAALSRRAGALLTCRLPDAVCPYTTLARSKAQFMANLPRRLQRLLRGRHKLEQSRKVELFLWGDRGEEIGAGIDELARLHALRFAAKGAQTLAFGSPRYREFHQEAAARMHRRGALRLYCLALDGVVVAMLYCLRHHDTVYYFQSGFDPAYGNLSVGQLTFAYAMEHAIGEGVRRFDFLKGDYAYKAEWATGRRRTVRLVAARPRVAGARALLAHGYRPLLSAARSYLRGARDDLGARLRESLGLRPDHVLRHYAKYGVAAALYHSGALGAALKGLRLIDREQRLVVLAYHKVLPRAEKRPGESITVSTENFATQVAVLAKLFAAPAPEQALATLDRRPERRTAYPLLVTFDDGYENVLAHAWPPLRRNGVPFVFFVVTGALGTDELLWTDEVVELLVRSPHQALAFRFGGKLEHHPLDDEGQRMELAAFLKRRLKRLDQAGFEATLEELRRAAGVTRIAQHERTHLLAWDDIRFMQRDGVEIGGHGLTHMTLARLPSDRLATEIRETQARFTRELGAPGRYFAYPNGYPEDVDGRTVAEVRGDGFTRAFTMVSRVATAADHPHLLPRIAPEDEPGVMLGLELVRILAAEVLRPSAWLARAAPPALQRTPIVAVSLPVPAPSVEVAAATAPATGTATAPATATATATATAAEAVLTPAPPMTSAAH
ncbi:MAG TPA: GNAT family N-acetyltransferase [Polyangia bacterium]|jgi:CelD/BcsL family acetyltransferase involved in cellulose biosynthesis/peptidoglycan/xylan/chitin deacetylase (PgdA/CDA1 family)